MTLTLAQARLLRVRDRCSVCGGALQPSLDLGEVALPRYPATVLEETPSAPLRTAFCEDCSSLQLTTVVSRPELFTQYGYRSGASVAMRQHLADLAAEAKQRLSLLASDIVLDIGANDGTFLAMLAPSQRVGFEPSDAAEGAPPEAGAIARDFFSASMYSGLTARKAKMVSSLAMFYDLESPGDFCHEVAEVLADDGLWVLEMNYLLDMLRQTAFDFIVHEHVTLYFLSTLNRVLRPAGLHVLDVSRNSVNGGSIRAWIGHRRSFRATSGAVDRMLWDELLWRDKARVDDFARKSLAAAAQVGAWLADARAQGKSVMAYGASTRGGTTLAAAGVDGTLVEGVAEIDARKIGRFTAQGRLPIISEDAFRQRRPDYLLVLPWWMADYFQRREAAYLAAGGQFIVPLPTPRLVKT